MHYDSNRNKIVHKYLLELSMQCSLLFFFYQGLSIQSLYNVANDAAFYNKRIYRDKQRNKILWKKVKIFEKS